MNCKLTWNGGVSDYTFTVDFYSPIQVRQRSLYKTINGTTKSYTLWNKWKFNLAFNNITSDIETNFKTIWDLDTELVFYPDDSVTETSYTVYWISDNYPFKTPINNSHQFINKLYQGEMELEEI